jgi:DNA-binding response OmpR family regulator
MPPKAASSNNHFNQLPRILIVDDEPNIRFVLERALQYEGYFLETAANGAEAIQKLNNAPLPYDLLLLDLRMEPINGLQVLQAAKEQDPDVVAIILTAHGSLESAVETLRLGAFDYLFKPTTPETIRQRVHEAIQQRQQILQRQRLLQQIESLRQTLNELDSGSNSLPPPTVKTRFLHSGALIIDRHHRQATLADTLLDLTTAEFDLLVCLVTAAPKPLSPRELVNRALGYDSEDAEARDIIKWHIHHLRRKIEPNPAHPRHIKTVRHQGYLWSNGS